MKNKNKILKIVGGVVAIFLIFGPLSSLIIWSFAEKWFWPHALPQEWGLLYWKKIGDTQILKSLTISVVIASITTLFCLLITIPFSYILTRRKFPAKTLILLIFMLPQAFPQLPIFANLLTDFYKWNLAGTITGVTIVHITLGMVYSLWILVSVFQSIPQNLELAAYNLGASKLRTFFQITLPQAIPGIVAAAILVFLNSLDEFTGSLLIGAPYVKTLSVFMYNTAMGYEMQIASVASLLLALPGVIMLVALDRYLKSEYLSGFGRL